MNGKTDRVVNLQTVNLLELIQTNTKNSIREATPGEKKVISEAFKRLEAARRDEIPIETLEIWREYLINSGLSIPQIVEKIISASRSSDVYGVVKYSDIINAEPVDSLLITVRVMGILEKVLNFYKLNYEKYLKDSSFVSNYERLTIEFTELKEKFYDLETEKNKIKTESKLEILIEVLKEISKSPLSSNFDKNVIIKKINELKNKL